MFHIHSRHGLPGEERRARTDTQGHDATQPPVIRWDPRVLKEIRASIGSRPAEQGGMLGGSREKGVVTHFHFDSGAQCSGATYTPDVATVNRVLQEWNSQGVDLMGFVHSHPPGLRRPSDGDLEYAERILAHNPQMGQMLMPIVISTADRKPYALHPWLYTRDRGGAVRPFRIAAATSDPVAPAAPDPARSCLARVVLDADCDVTETYRRVANAYDRQRLQQSRLVVIGAGGSVQFLEDLARAGVGEFIVIDHDVVSETNLATQHVYRRDIGRPKVAALARRIWEINPSAHVKALQHPLDDLDDHALAQLLKEPLRADGQAPQVVLLGAFTDSFPAQARANRLALHFGIPSISAQMYREGRGGEIVFTYPGITPACQRCILSSRYRAYLDEGFHNDVTSDGTPIMATTRLNALAGFVALALLQHGSTHPRWGGMLARIGNRNLVQVRMDPDLASTLGLVAFDKAFEGGDGSRILFDEAVWLPQEQECPGTGYPTCPDCGGSGDLRTAIGTFEDTRVMRQNAGPLQPQAG